MNHVRVVDSLTEMVPPSSTLLDLPNSTPEDERRFLPLEVEPVCDLQMQKDKQAKMYSIGLFAITTTLLYADQNLLAPNLSQVALEFGFSDMERDRKLGGDISLAFFLLGVPASLLIGCWGDQSDRMLLTAWTIGLGEGACFLTYFVRTYQQLFFCRALTGLSLGGAVPLMYSVLGDWFRAEDRHIVTALVGIGTGAGIALGQGISGFTGPQLGWRFPFLLVSIPALACALLLGCTVKDPERGCMDNPLINRNNSASGDSIMSVKATSEENANRRAPRGGIFGQDWGAHRQTFLQLLSTKTFLLSLFQGAPGCVPWGIVNTFLNDFLSMDRGMSVEGATTIVLLFGVGNFFGMLMGGGFGRSLYHLNPRYPSLFSGSMAILGCVPFWMLLNDVDVSTSIFKVVAISVLAGAGSGVTGPIVKATLQNVTLPHARGQAFALFNTFDDFGRGLGPMFVSLLIVHTGSRTIAFNIGVLGWICCGFFNLCMFFFVENDERLVRNTMLCNMLR